MFARACAPRASIFQKFAFTFTVVAEMPCLQSFRPFAWVKTLSHPFHQSFTGVQDEGSVKGM
jgi:hypothetical protein